MMCLIYHCNLQGLLSVLCEQEYVRYKYKFTWIYPFLDKNKASVICTNLEIPLGHLLLYAVC